MKIITDDTIMTVPENRFMTYIAIMLTCLFLIFACWLVTSARAANALSEIHYKDLAAQDKAHADDIKCYEKLHDATFLYLDIYRSNSGMKIAVGHDDDGACKELAKRRPQR